MRVCVISGSPKGQGSITFQTVRFLERYFADDEFEVFHVGRQPKRFEREMEPVLDALRAADLVLFCYPVYTFVVPYQLHRFIELLKEHGFEAGGKPAAQVLTSKHFFDVTAMRFIRENCDDMGFSYAGELSADMEDLLAPKGRDEAVAFWKLVRWRVEQGVYLPRVAQSAVEPAPYEAAFASVSCEAPSSASPPALPNGPASAPEPHPLETVVVSSGDADDAGLAAMIDDFSACFEGSVRVVNLREFPFDGGCLSCFNCAADGRCFHKDGFDAFLREQIQTADAIVYAFALRDHSMGSLMKLYDDRQFCNGHRTVTSGMPVGYLVRGNIEGEPGVAMVIEGRANVGGNYLCGVACDPQGVRELAATLGYALRENLTQPANFLGVGGTKIFRDLIWVMKGLMRADHRYYKQHGVYDFPQKQRSTIVKMRLVGALFANPKIRAKMGGKMSEGMLAPYEKMLSQVFPE